MHYATLALLLALATDDAIAALFLRPRKSYGAGYYGDFIPLSSANLSVALDDDGHAWVLQQHKSCKLADLKRQTAPFRGLLRFGCISEADAEAGRMLGANSSQQKFNYRALPFGGRNWKLNNFKDFKQLEEATAFADSSVPSDAIPVLRSKSQLQRVIAGGVAARPSRFTVLFTSKNETKTLLQRMVSHSLSLAFNFCLLPNADDPSALASVGLPSTQLPVPGLSVLAVQAGGAVQSYRLNEEKRPWEKMDYAELLRFLIEFNRKFRPELPGDAQSYNATVRRMTEVLRQESLVFDISDADTRVKQEL